MITLSVCLSVHPCVTLCIVVKRCYSKWQLRQLQALVLWLECPPKIPNLGFSRHVCSFVPKSGLRSWFATALEPQSNVQNVSIIRYTDIIRNFANGSFFCRNATSCKSSQSYCSRSIVVWQSWLKLRRARLSDSDTKWALMADFHSNNDPSCTPRGCSDSNNLMTAAVVNNNTSFDSCYQRIS